MNKIKEQVSSLVAFNATELDTLNQEYSAISKRLEEGISKMSDSHLFSDKEIKEIQTHANSILGTRYRAAKDDIISKKRDEFQF